MHQQLAAEPGATLSRGGDAAGHHHQPGTREQFGHDLDRIYQELKRREETSGRRYVSHPPRPVALGAETED